MNAAPGRAAYGNEANPVAGYPPPAHPQQSAAASSASAQAGAGDAVVARLQAVLDRFEISIANANDLVQLADYEMCVIADDSGSMQLPAQPAHMRRIGQPARSRWEELKETVAEMVEIASCFDESGVDLFFLNRPPLMGVKGSADPRFAPCFENGPRGGTPLTEMVHRVAGQFASSEKKIILFILTDGEPNGGKQGFISAVRSVVQGGRVKVQVMACTSEESEIAWLNDLDAESAAVDVTDDFYAEQAEVLRAGKVTRFTRGDWCMKAMLGPVSSKFDGWDESHGSGGGRKKKPDECGMECCIM